MLVMLDRKQVFRLQTWQTSALQPQYCQVDGGGSVVLTHTFNRRSGYWLCIVVTYGCFPNPTWFRINKKYDITIVTLLVHVSALKRLWYNGPRPRTTIGSVSMLLCFSCQQRNNTTLTLNREWRSHFRKNCLNITAMSKSKQCWYSKYGAGCVDASLPFRSNKSQHGEWSSLCSKCF